MARIPALEPPFTPDAEAQLATMMPAGMPPIGLFRTFAKNLPMTIAMSHWGRYELGRDLTLTLREREIVILRTCARCGCEYEWGVHVMVFADRAGLTPAEVTSLTCGSPDDPYWTAGREAMLIRMVDALHDSSRRRRRTVAIRAGIVRREATTRRATAVRVVPRDLLRRPHRSRRPRARCSPLRRRHGRLMAGPPVAVVNACTRRGEGGSPTTVVIDDACSRDARCSIKVPRWWRWRRGGRPPMRRFGL